jgi:hypothetical protein
VGRTLLSDAFDVDLIFDLDFDREGHGFSRVEKAPLLNQPGFSRVEKAPLLNQPGFSR